MRRVTFLLMLWCLSSLAAFAQTLSLDEAIAKARRESGALRVKAYETEKAQASLKDAESKRFPKLEFQGSASWMTNPPEGIVITKGSLGYSPTPTSSLPLAVPDQDYVLVKDYKNTYFKFSAVLSQPIFTWGKINNAIDIARLDTQVAEVNRRTTELETVRDLKLAYAGALFARDSLALLKEAESVLTQIVEDRERSFKEETINLQSVLEAKANLASLRSQLVQAEEGYKSALDAIAFFTGLDASSLELTSSFRKDLPVLDDLVLKQKALSSSPDMESLGYKLKQAEAYKKIEEASGMFRPDFALQVSFNVEGQDIPFASRWTKTWDTNLIISIGTKMNIFDSLSSIWKTQAAEASINMAVTGIEELRKGLALKVRKAIESVRNGYAVVQERESQAKLADEQYRNAQVSFENELITRQEERGALVAKISANLQHLVALYQYQNALVNLEFIISGEL